ncbi:MAG: SpoIIIAH-like family protein [Lachnospiraceae bacterium]|nr:SpoIIIAH-like family protein [Lachnospiraceae bacterium]
MGRIGDEKLKKNQIMITALAVMIAIAGYLNFAGNKIGEESLVVTDELMTEEEMTALLDLSEEDIYSDIGDLEDEAGLVENYLDEDMEYSEIMVDMSGSGEESREDVIEGTPGEAVFTSTQAVSTLSAARLLKEQTRARNKEMLQEIVNNEILDSAQKEEAVESMVAMTDRNEKEMEAEILLSTKGFTETVVSIGDNSVDVVVYAETLNDAQLAQIMDIVTRKTQIKEENIIISRVGQK